MRDKISFHEMIPYWDSRYMKGLIEAIGGELRCKSWFFDREALISYNFGTKRIRIQCVPQDMRNGEVSCKYCSGEFQELESRILNYLIDLDESEKKLEEKGEDAQIGKHNTP